MKKIYLYNGYHLGDHIIDCVIFYNIKDYIETNDIHIFYSVKPEYRNEIREFICSDNIHLNEYYIERDHQTWVGNPRIKSNVHSYSQNNDKDTNMFINNKLCWDKVAIYYFKDFLNILSIPLEIERFSYKDTELINIYNNFLPTYYKDVDIVINNCFPMSGQIDYDVNLWDEYITNLAKTTQFKIVTTKKVNGVMCTLDNNFNVKQIAAISTHSKIIIAINSGPIIGMLNDYTLNNVKKIFVFDKRNTFSYEQSEHKENITDININELNKIINDFH